MRPGIARRVKLPDKAKGRRERSARKPEWKRNGALAGERRGTNEEANLPLAGNYDGLGLGRGSSQLHDDDDCRSSGNGNHSVHDNAQLAVICVGIVRMKVSGLGYGQHRQQEQTQDRHSRQKARRDAISGAASYALGGAAFAAENCGESRHGACQPLRPSTSILQKAYRRLDALGGQGLHRSYNSETSSSKNADWARASKLSCHDWIYARFA